MQTSLAKRNLMTLLESGPVEKSKYFLEPKKKVKTCLQIDIPDSFVNDCEPLPISTSRAGHSKFSFRGSLNLQTCKASTSTSPQCTDRTPYVFDFTKFFSDSESLYDNFYQEEEYYNITMKKCHRRKMEDRVTIEKISDNHSNNLFFGIYDGHRNSYVSDYLQRNLHKTILGHPDVYVNTEKAMRESFRKIDQDVCKNQEKLKIQGGSTALCGIMNQNGMYLANVGDSKAIVIRGGKARNLNVEHRANNEEEKKQVENKGGIVFEKKGQSTSRFLVQGALELTRSIGDINYKQYISAEPDVLEYKFDANDEYIILASDGFWNEISEEEACELIQSFGESKALSKLLVEEALKKKHYNIDNITLIVIDLKRYVQINPRLE